MKLESYFKLEFFFFEIQIMWTKHEESFQDLHTVCMCSGSDPRNSQKKISGESHPEVYAKFELAGSVVSQPPSEAVPFRNVEKKEIKKQKNGARRT